MSYEKLTEAGLKVTIQRMAIWEFLENTDTHPTAEMVYIAIKKKYPNVTLSTIYNTLETFVEKKIIKKIFTLEGKTRYDAKMEKHHHLFDKNTGQIIDIFDNELNKIITDYLKNNKTQNFQIEDFYVDFIGEINSKK